MAFIKVQTVAFLESFFRKPVELVLIMDSHKLTMAFRLKNKKLSVGEALQFEKHKWFAHRMSLRREKAIAMAMALKLSCTRQELEAFRSMVQLYHGFEVSTNTLG